MHGHAYAFSLFSVNVRTQAQIFILLHFCCFHVACFIRNCQGMHQWRVHYMLFRFHTQGTWVKLKKKKRMFGKKKLLFKIEVLNIGHQRYIAYRILRYPMHNLLYAINVILPILPLLLI